jgi:hypothetical protein
MRRKRRGDHGLVNLAYGEKMQPRIMEDTEAKTNSSRHHLATKMCTLRGCGKSEESLHSDDNK